MGIMLYVTLSFLFRDHLDPHQHGIRDTSFHQLHNAPLFRSINHPPIHGSSIRSIDHLVRSFEFEFFRDRGNQNYEIVKRHQICNICVTIFFFSSFFWMYDRAQFETDCTRTFSNAALRNSSYVCFSYLYRSYIAICSVYIWNFASWFLISYDKSPNVYTVIAAVVHFHKELRGKCRFIDLILLFFFLIFEDN